MTVTVIPFHRFLRTTVYGTCRERGIDSREANIIAALTSQRWKERVALLPEQGKRVGTSQYDALRRQDAELDALRSLVASLRADLAAATGTPERQLAILHAILHAQEEEA